MARSGSPEDTNVPLKRGTGMHRTLADQVAADLHAAILRNEFPAGSWLRINELAEQYDTSSMPVREALRRMGALGLVEVVPHRGARVSELSVADLQDTYRARIVIESALVREAARKFTQDVARKAGNALAAHESFIEAGDVEQAREAHTDFHLSIYRVSGDSWLLRCLEPVWQNSERYRFAALNDASAQRRSHTEHVEILKACSQGDPDRAADALGRHLEGAVARISDMMV